MSRNMSKKELMIRYLYFTVGLFVSALGVSLITKASLGTSPISSLPYTLSLGFPLTLGTFTFLLNMVLILGQIVILKKDFSKIQLLQIPVSVVFGYFIDYTMSLLSKLDPTNYFQKLFILLIGCAVLALGVSIEVIANVVMLSGEALVNAISTRSGKEFGSTKVYFDVSLVIVAGIVSVLLFGKLVGIREGTIIAAAVVGTMARFFNKMHRLIYNNLQLGKLFAREDEFAGTD